MAGAIAYHIAGIIPYHMANHPTQSVLSTLLEPLQSKLREPTKTSLSLFLHVYNQFVQRAAPTLIFVENGQFLVTKRPIFDITFF